MKVSVEGLKEELAGNIVLDGHFLLRSEVDGQQRHSEFYVNKEEFYSNPFTMFNVVNKLYVLCEHIEINCIIGPDRGGNKLAVLMVNKFLYKNKAVYAPQTKKTEGGGFCVVGGEQYIKKGANILLVEDIVTTGGSVKKLQKLISSLGGDIVRIACIVNRGGVRASDFGLKESQFLSLYEVDIPSYSTKDCPQEILERPINKKYGARMGGELRS